MKRGRRVIAAIIAMCAAVSFAAGLGKSQQVFDNHLQTGKVLIQVTEYEKYNGKIQPIRSDNLFTQGLAEGQMVSYIPRVTNLRGDCYVRLHVRITGDDNTAIPVTGQTIKNINADWIQKGDYLYCQKVMKTGDEEDPFEGIVVPESISNIKKVHVDVVASAIQAMNVKPDFALADPWEAEQIASASVKGGKHRVVFQKEQVTSCDSTDLFDGFDAFMPGDIKDGELSIQNQSGSDADIYLRTEGKEEDLAERMNLQITCGGKKVYDGALLSKELSDKVKIASIRDEGEETLQFQVILPAETDNQYTESKTDVRWILSMQRVDPETFEKQKTPPAEKSPAKATSADLTDKAVDTGEQILPVMIATALLTLAVIVMIIAISLRRRRE